MVIAVKIDGRAWKARGLPATWVRRAAESALRVARRASAPSAVSVSLAGDRTVAKLNGTWRDRKGPTNVLAFPSPQGFDGFLGDVILSAGVVAREAKAQGKPLKHHAAHLVVHGVLHLLGHDHGRRMERLEVRALETLGIPDPYQERTSRPSRRRQ